MMSVLYMIDPLAIENPNNAASYFMIRKLSSPHLGLDLIHEIRIL